MAKIKGIELKNITDFRGHEGEELTQANVYYKGKKVGYYSQDAWGGPDIFNLDYDLDKETRDKVNEITNNYIGGKLFEKLDDLYNETYHVDFKYEQKGYEYLFMDLLQLKDHEDLYKKYKKKYGYDNIAIIYDDLFKRGVFASQNKVDLSAKFPNKTYFEYNSLNDFIKE